MKCAPSFVVCGAVLVGALVAGCPAPMAVDPDGGASGECSEHADCDDGIDCTGVERCLAGDGGVLACVPGTSPCETGEVCDEDADRCVVADCETPDADGDGEDSIACGGLDCDDDDRNRSPARTEICDVANRDEDCNEATFGVRDADADGVADATCCNGEGASQVCGTDCDDTSATVSPRVAEVCNGIDDDCNGTVDEGMGVMVWLDADGDGYGTGSPSMGCPGAVGQATVDGDCDDAERRRNPGLPEACDGLDNDCDSTIDDGVTPAPQYRDMDGDGYGDPLMASAPICMTLDGYVTNDSDCDDTDPMRRPGAPERCNALDDNCDGAAPEDQDGDGYVATTAMCVGGVRADCDDFRAATHPGATETCNDVDDDCSGTIDGGCLLDVVPDGDPNNSLQRGGSGGSPFSESCGAGLFMAGLEIYVDSDSLQRIRLRCRDATVTRTAPDTFTVGTGATTTSTITYGSGGTGPTALDCPPNQFIRAIRMFSDSVVRQVWFQCGSIVDGGTAGAYTFSTSGAGMTTMVGPGGGTVSVDFCDYTASIGGAERTVAVGIAGRSGSAIDALRLVCDDLRATTR